ncbi:hypothetical protein U0035_08355 [Niabella yanshanensis]|uniref:Lipoprotein n=1 Tax=Niabella yanshanensis TaxID=577386 RepID=A0ABZ0WBX1_9BACT|nr:hypothetical protein [Niabella yanshanensis]WQD40153.1 hypothetical protein U0035_08355 [Niabella yanshanensis]
MKKKCICFSMLLLVVFLYSCSIRPMYIIRNTSRAPVAVILTVKGVNDSIGGGNLEIARAEEIVPLKKSDLARVFVSKITGTWSENGARRFEIPAGSSADITSLLEQISPGRDPEANFSGSALEIKYAHSALVLGNNIAEVQRIFEVKSFFLSGPLVYYLDPK